MKQLLQLDLINNPVSKLPGYREKVFKIFPSLTILDTLDKSGKDAYAGSSMALSVSRVPDALFDKSAPVPVYVPPPMLVATAARTKSISKPAATSATSAAIPPVVSSAPLTSTASLSRIRTNSKSSIKPTHGVASGKMGGKSGKMGKLGKTAHITKSRSASSRAGITFPVGRIKRKLK